jgi:hypothetical protein
MYKIFFYFFAFALPTVATAQNAYNISVFNEPYQDLTDPISLNNGTVWDDPTYAIPLGFNFQISTHNFNTVYIVEDYLGGTLSSSPDTGSGIAAYIALIGQDIIDLGFDSGISLSPLSYKLEGSAGSRILKIEFKNVGFYEDSTISDFMNFQVWLYEGSNTIQYRYGPRQINNPVESYQGETGPVVGFLPSFDNNLGELAEDGYAFEGNPANPTIVVLHPGDIFENALTGTIPNGTVYQFEVNPLSVEENDTDNFQLYPNPVKNRLLLQSPITASLKVKIFNLEGKLLSNENLTVEKETSIDISQLQSGIYFLSIQDENGITEIKKFLKE